MKIPLHQAKKENQLKEVTINKTQIQVSDREQFSVEERNSISKSQSTEKTVIMKGILLLKYRQKTLKISTRAYQQSTYGVFSCNRL